MIKNVRSLGISLRRWVAALAVGVLPVVVQAFPATVAGGFEYAASVGSVAGSWFSTPSAACSADAAGYTAIKASQGYNVPHSSSVSGTAGSYLCRITNEYDSWQYGIASRTAPTTYSCPANATLAGSSCSCNSGYTESANTCTVVDVVDLLNKAGVPLVGDGPCPANMQSCFQGSTVRASGGTCWKDKTTGKPAYELYGPFTDLKKPCSVTPASGGGSAVAEPSTPSPSDCNGYWGQVDGKDRCIPKSGSTGTGTVEKGDSTTTTTGTGGTTTADDQKSTACVDGVCTTTGTKTVTNPDGTTTSTTTTTQQQQTDYCSSNPAAAACKTAEWCETHPETVGCSEFGTPDDSVKLSKSDFGFNSITAVSFANSASCPSDVSFTAMGKSYAFSYGSMCGTAQNYVAPVVVALGVALAAFVFVGGFRS
jgi:hypothetical protein